MATASASILNSTQSQFKHSIGPWRPLWLFCLALQVAMLIADLRNPRMIVTYSGFLSSAPFLVFSGALTLTLAFHIIRMIVLARPKSPLLFLLRHGQELLKTPARWAIPAINYVSIITLLLSFSKLKALVGTASPFLWDGRFTQIDRNMHFGIDPWRITHGIFDTDIASWALNMAYNMWFGLLLASIFACILLNLKTQLRAQFLLTMSVMWILGGFAVAMIFASAGPCYVHLIEPGGTNPYSDLMQGLQTTHTRLLAQNFAFGLPALATQDMLWKDFVTNGDILGGGISAFPSMHVAMAVAMALLASRLNRYLAIAAWAFALIIQIGSVHLAWHYAVDGYASAILTVAVWKLCGWLIRRSDSSTLARHGDQFHLHARL